MTLTFVGPSPRMISTIPSMWLISALPFGTRASNSSSTRQTGGDVQAGDAAGMERPHRQLRAGLADRLGGDDADRLADADHLAGRQVAAVARPADAVAGLAGQRRADEDLVDPASSIRCAASSVMSSLRSMRKTDGLLALLELDRRVGQRGGRKASDEPALGDLLVGRLGADDPAPPPPFRSRPRG